MDYMRGNMLSRNIAIKNGVPVITRMIEKTLLTSVMKPSVLSVGECHLLASLSLFSTSLCPLSRKLIDLRL